MLLCLCGEYGLRTLYTFMIWGSSPHMRGIQSPMGMFPAYARFTPAHAGNTESVPAMFLQAQVHPRSRGEYFSVLVPVIRDIGSPPLTRGIRACPSAESVQSGFTPAHAGNTSCGMSFNAIKRVHPRSRGEYIKEFVQNWLEQGSPPLTRGILMAAFRKGRMSRFTPAHAGNTPAHSCSVPKHWVHPRSRGEYVSFQTRLTPVLGSPPLTRGIRDLSD